MEIRVREIFGLTHLKFLVKWWMGLALAFTWNSPSDVREKQEREKEERRKALQIKYRATKPNAILEKQSDMMKCHEWKDDA
jgi:hypothetical protein